MDKIMLARIESLHVRTVQETGLRLNYRGRTFYTGTITSVLDNTGSVENMALFDFDSGKVKIQWSLIATMPFLADAIARGEIEADEAAPVRVSFEEDGIILPNGREFEVSGPGIIAPGSVFSPCIVASGNRGGIISNSSTNTKVGTLLDQLHAGSSVRMLFVPEGSVLTIKLPASLGGGEQELNLTGGFSLTKVLSLSRQAAAELRESPLAVAAVA